jgi:hypothetical protein
MLKMLKTTRPAPHEIRRLVLEYAGRSSSRPLLIGAVAMHLGWWATLAETENLLEGLVSEGLLRHLTSSESILCGVRHGYVLIGIGTLQLVG